MTAAGAFTPDSEIDRIFAPVVQARSYRNLLYLALSFPLGILYFVILITGLSVGAGLAILFVGFLIIGATLWLARVFGRGERELTKALLGATFEPSPPVGRGWRAMLMDSRSWTTIVFLMLRFPLGVLSFVVVLLFTISIPIMAAPLLYTMFPVTFVGPVETSEEALLVSLFGCVLFLLSVHAVNGLAALSRRLAMALI